MRRIHILITLSVLLLASFSAGAREISKSDATKLATDFLYGNKTTRGFYGVQEVVLKRTKAAGNPNFYIFNKASGKGFVIISADDVARPVLGYSFDESFCGDNMPASLSGWLDELDREIVHIKNSGATEYRGEDDWENLKTSNNSGHKPVVLHNTALWNQSEPFNNMTPANGTTHAVTGCVMTAIATFLKYSHDVEGMELKVKKAIDNTYTVKWKSGEISGNVPINREYDWGNMRYDNYKNGYTEAEASAVAQLMADLGIMQGADYGTSATSAITEDISENLIEYFGFDEDAECLSRDRYATDVWCRILRNELNSRPIIYSGSTESSGHCFILDGYASYDYFHINWGWGGTSNGYFAIDAFQSDTQGIGGSDGAGYIYNQDAQIGLKGENGRTDTLPSEEAGLSPNFNYITADYISSDAKIFSPNSSYYFTAHSLTNHTSQDLTIYIYPYVVSKLDEYKSNAKYIGYFTLASGRSYNLGFNFIPERICLGDNIEFWYARSQKGTQYNAKNFDANFPVIDAGFIIADDSYNSGETFKKEIFYGRTKPKSVTWYYDGKVSNGDIVLTSGRHKVEAKLEYGADHCYETIVREIIVN